MVRIWLVPTLLYALAMFLERNTGHGAIWGWLLGMAAIMQHPLTPEILRLFNGD